MNSALNVAKFGGTSVATYESMGNCAKIIANNSNTRIVVVSASAGVTNHLVALANTALTSQQIEEIIENIKVIELAIVTKLKKPEEVSNKLNALLVELSDLAKHEEINFRDDLKDALVSMGERMSSLLFAAVLREFAVSASNFDVRKVMRTDSRFTQAAPDLGVIRKLAQSLLIPELY
ncbi:MAG: lysine-sensitive aspartokinase 3, partial [Glaciecola sp.]